MYESITTTVCVKLNNIRDPSFIKMLFYSLALSLFTRMLILCILNFAIIKKCPLKNETSREF